MTGEHNFPLLRLHTTIFIYIAARFFIHTHTGRDRAHFHSFNLMICLFSLTVVD